MEKTDFFKSVNKPALRAIYFSEFKVFNPTKNYSSTVMSKPVILCVDDEPTILKSLKRLLYQAFENEYLYETAESADEALEVIEELEDDEISVIVIISDWLMPGMKGDEFLVKIHENYPQVVKILLTGQANEEAIERAKSQANLHEYIAKPWDDRYLIESIRSGLKN